MDTADEKACNKSRIAARLAGLNLAAPAPADASVANANKSRISERLAKLDVPAVPVDEAPETEPKKPRRGK